jgi:antitoxin ParD1/3/4
MTRLLMHAHLAEGEAQALRGEFVAHYSIEALLAESDRDAPMPSLC